MSDANCNDKDALMADWQSGDQAKIERAAECIDPARLNALTLDDIKEINAAGKMDGLAASPPASLPELTILDKVVDKIKHAFD